MPSIASAGWPDGSRGWSSPRTRHRAHLARRSPRARSRARRDGRSRRCGATPGGSIILVHRDAAQRRARPPTPAAPRSRLPTIFSALNSAAIITTAVPCWSSWKTGMSIDSFNRVLDLEAARGRDVLEVDAAEGRGDQLDRLDDLVGVLSGEADREGVDSGELLEQHRLALHHRHRRLGPDVAQPEHGAAVGDDRDRVLLDRVLEGLGAVGVDVLAYTGNAGRVGHREVVTRLQRVPCCAARSCRRGASASCGRRSRAPWRPGRANRSQDPLPVLAVLGVDRELAHPLSLAAGARHEIHALQLPARLSDRSGQFSERLLARVELDPDRDAVLGATAMAAIESDSACLPAAARGRCPRTRIEAPMNLGFLILADSSEAINGKVYAPRSGLERAAPAFAATGILLRHRPRRRRPVERDQPPSRALAPRPGPRRRGDRRGVHDAVRGRPPPR